MAPPPDPHEVGRFVHALRQPLGAFVNYLALLEEEQLTAEAQKHLEAMHADVKRMAAIIDAMATRKVAAHDHS